MNNRIKNVANGIVMGLINMVITIILPFVSRTIIIYSLGTEYVGLGGLFTSILSVLSLSELGVGAAISYALYKPIAEQDVDKVNAILKLYRTIYRIIGTVILVLSACLMPFLDVLVAGDLPNGMSLHKLFVLYVINTVISYFIFGYKKVLLTAHQRYDLEVNINSIILVLQYVLQIIILLTTKNYYLYVIAFPACTVINNLVANFVIRKKYSQYKCKGSVSKQELFSLYKNVGGAFFSKLGSTIYLSVDNIVISSVLGLAVLGRYGNYYYIISSLIAVFAVVHNSLRPTLGNCVATETVESNWTFLEQINYIYMFAVTLCCSCCMALFQDFEKVWVGADNMLSNVMVALFVIYFFAGRTSAVLGIYQEAAGIWWQGKFIPIIAAAVNLIFNIIGVRLIGLPAILISSIIASLFVTLPGTMRIMFQNYFTEKQYYSRYVKELLKTTAKAIVVVVVSYSIMIHVPVTGWGSLIIKGILCALLSLCVLTVLNINNPMFKEMVEKVFSKLRGKVSR